MKWIKYLSIVSIFIMWVACSSFDRYMKDSKDFMVQGDYEKAIEQLNLAIIENPTDKDAIALLEIAEKKLEDKTVKEQNEKMRAVSNDLIAFIIENITPINVEIITVEEAKNILPEAKKQNLLVDTFARDSVFMNVRYSDAVKLTAFPFSIARMLSFA